MLSTNIIQFEYRTKAGVIEPNDCVISLFSELIQIKGELRRQVFDPVKKRSVNMTGLFIQYEGVEYGSLTTRLDQLLATLATCNCVEDEFRIFDDPFDFEFE